jgi:hypothetical protein
MNFIAIAGVITVRVLYSYYLRKQQTPITFLSREDVVQFFRKDPDQYFESFNELNLRGFGYDDKQTMIDDACRSARSFNTKEQEYISKKCMEADQFLEQFNDIPYFPSKKVAKIKWVLAKTFGRLYEKGFPHTRLNIIFLTDRFTFHKNLTQVLVHEKVHLFSRLYPNDMRRWMDKNGYILYKKMSDYPLAKANPDVDGMVYVDKNNQELVLQYNSYFPTSFDDVNFSLSGTNCLIQDGKYDLDCASKEHPNEVLAYKVDSYVPKYIDH